VIVGGDLLLSDGESFSTVNNNAISIYGRLIHPRHLVTTSRTLDPLEASGKYPAT
jgi:hypothetical protein